MLNEKRKNQRRPLVRQVWIDLGDGSPAVQCVLGNLSDTGAKLVCTLKDDLPECFVLRLSMDGRVARKCRVKWKTDNEIGVAFTARLVSGASQIVKAAEG